MQPQPASCGRHPPGQWTQTHPPGYLRPYCGRGPQAAGDGPPDVWGDLGGGGHPRPHPQPAGRTLPAGCGSPERQCQGPAAEAGPPAGGQALQLLQKIVGRTGAESDGDRPAAPRPAHPCHPQAAE